jgi:hypothetical protein
MSKKLVGADDAAGNQQSVGYFTLCQFTAVATGNMTQFRVKSSVAGNVKCAIYANSAGEPGALITAMNTGQAVIAGQWNALTFTLTSITSGTVYWLAFIFDITGALDYRTLSGGIRRYKAETYAGWTFPNPAGSGFDSTTNYVDLEAGWGPTIVELTETVTFTDSLPKVVTKLLTEIVSFTDALSKIRAKTLTEVVTFTDSLICRVTKVLTETVTFTDTLDVRRWLTPTRTQMRTREQAATRNEPATREEA